MVSPHREGGESSRPTSRKNGLRRGLWDLLSFDRVRSPLTTGRSPIPVES